jgi:hypothetical protein
VFSCGVCQAIGPELRRWAGVAERGFANRLAPRDDWSHAVAVSDTDQRVLADKGWAAASLRIFTKILTFQQISDQLGLSPDFGGNAGDVVRPGRPSHLKTTMWGLASRLPAESLLNEHILDVVVRLADRQEAVEALWEQCDLEVFAGVFSRTGQIEEALPWATLAVMAKLRVDLHLDLYPPDGDDGVPTGLS